MEYDSMQILVSLNAAVILLHHSEEKKNTFQKLAAGFGGDFQSIFTVKKGLKSSSVLTAAHATNLPPP